MELTLLFQDDEHFSEHKKTKKHLKKYKTSDACANDEDILLNSFLNEKIKSTDVCVNYFKKQRKDSASTDEIEESYAPKKQRKDSANTKTIEESSAPKKQRKDSANTETIEELSAPKKQRQFSANTEKIEESSAPKKQRKDSANTEENNESSASKKKFETEQPKSFQESPQKLDSVNKNTKSSSKNIEKEIKSVRKKLNKTSEEQLSNNDSLEFLPSIKAVEKSTGEPQIAAKKTVAKRKKLERENEVNDASKHKTINTEKTASDSIKRTLSETGFLWDVKPEDLVKPDDNCEEDNTDEVSSIYFCFIKTLLLQCSIMLS